MNTNYKVYLGIFFLMFCLPFIASGQAKKSDCKIIKATEFGAFPNDEKDDTEALRRAVRSAASYLECAILYIEPGIYHISDPLALKIQEEAMSGKLGANPQDKLFIPNQEYAIGLDFEGAENLVIEAAGVQLLCDGWMEPLSFRNAKNITLNGITIDYKRRPNNQGEVMALGSDYVEVCFTDKEMLQHEQVVLRIMVFDKEKNAFTGAGVYHEKMEFVAPNTVRFYGKKIRNQSGIGNMLLTFSGYHYRPAILIYKTQNIELNHVTIHSQAGMGIVGHLSENITMNHLRVVPSEGRYASTNTDATHFATNRGLIRFNGCEFAGQGDDATNVHTYYVSITNTSKEGYYDIMVDRNNYTHSSYLDEPTEGDIMALVDKNTMDELDYVRVRRFWSYPLQDKVRIQFDGTLPEKIEDYYLINISASPRLEFVNNTIRSHRARSVLVKTRKVLIQDNSFENTTGTAIHLGVEGDWGEGPASEDVVISGNEFTNCGLGGANDGTLDGASAIALHVKAKNTSVQGLHKRILIYDNTIDGGQHAIVVRGSEDVTLRNNVFKNIDGDPIIIGSSKRVSAFDNKGAETLNTDVNVPILPNL
ncbi:right-handed parallel beta-helix repeat-containing protein [Arenibacter sp. H213]|uniref:Right handed beta helix region n=1 Tax=Arenibacter antarcticus TaxID=2040469 RepID=A0ABW5VJQ4_9FLAO|nr:right-handed parallel beta-helix repeat-containing protein [Arenibacter sp. H213]